jgi:DNA-binding LacI/PurR family transcriptional regulator/signal transduction histidine kinase/ActR/RegA family two-component response regulator
MSLLDRAYQSRIAEAFHDAAQKLDLELVLLFGRALREPNPFSKSHNAIFDLIEPRHTDGVVAISTVLASNCGPSGVSRFLDRYAGLPIVSVGAELPRVPSVIVDNQGAMEAVVDHVISAHGRRRIAFLAGTPDNPESEARLAGYRRALERHGLAFDPALVAYGNFVHWSARVSAAELLDRAGAIDALIAANDSMAFAAIDVLRERQLSVPEDVAVTGFDDVWLGRLGNVALTTVAQPFDSIAEHALSLVLSQITGGHTETVVHVPADVAIRRSCGCTPGKQREQELVAETAAESPAEHLRLAQARVAGLLQGAFARVRSAQPGHAQVLFGGLRSELDGTSGAFLGAVKEVLERCRGDHDAHQALHNAIDALREDFEPVADKRLDALWYRALSGIAHGTMASGVEHSRQLDNEYLRMLTTSDRVSVALDLMTLGDAMVASLRHVGIQTAFVSRFADESGNDLEPLVSLVDGKLPEGVGAKFDASRLMPPDGNPDDLRRTFAVFPLVFETRWLGVAAFEYAVGGHGYQMLRDQFATALGHVTLHGQILNKTMLHERSVQERQATTRRLEGLSVLAGGVAHDLNNTLGPLLALPDIMIAELERAGAARPGRDVLETVREDMETIKSAGLRAAQTIKDLLTLGRQGRTPKESLDLNRVAELELANTLRSLAKDHPAVRIRVELSREALTVRGSEAHLARAVANLVRNAAEAITGPGEVVVRTENVNLLEPASRYETIPAGEYVVLSVSDTGCGIPAAEVERVFEPFFSRKRLGDQSGSGLGLAIVYGTAKEHDGFVDLASQVGVGTTFSLYFPRADEPSRPSSVRPAPTGSARILVVDDDPLQARIARRVLTHLGYRVDVMNSGSRALEVLNRAIESEEGRYELLLLDVMLNEELDGLELLDRIRRVHSGQKAVIASGQAQTRRVEKKAAPRVTWLAKPYTTADLAKAVASALATP